MKKFGKRVLLTSAFVAGLFAASDVFAQNCQPAFTGNFTDITNAQDQKVAQELLKHCITSGCGDQKFCPNNNLTKMDAAVFLGRALEEKGMLTIGTTCDNPFPDVTQALVDDKSNKLYREACLYISALKKKGYLSGSENSSFEPTREARREEAATMFANVFYKKDLDEYKNVTPSFSDVKSSDWAFTFIEALKRNCVVDGTGNNMFNPKNSIRRIDFAYMLARGMQYVTISGCVKDDCFVSMQPECQNDKRVFCDDGKKTKMTCDNDLVCKDGECVEEQKECSPVDDPICENSQTRKWCNNDGKYETRSCTCENGKCVECLSSMEPRCKDSTSYIVCEFNNEVAYSCDAGKTCSNGVCVNGQECDPGVQFSCEGDVMVSCSSSGKKSTQDCTSLGKVCDGGKCVVCKDNYVPECVGDQVRSCVNHQFANSACAKDEVCSSGACVKASGSCTKSEPTCNGDNVQTCEGGKIINTPCGSQTCVAGKCVDCDSSNFTNTCIGNAIRKCVNNAFDDSELCDSSEICSAGECIKNSSCAAGTKTCEGRNTIKTCNTEGVFEVKPCPSGKICSGGKCILEEDEGSEDPENADSDDENNDDDDVKAGDKEASQKYVSEGCSLGNGQNSMGWWLALAGLLGLVGLRRRKNNA